MANQQVSFTSPAYDYSADVASIERRRQLAAMLQQQGLQPEQEAPVPSGQFAVRTHPFQMAAKLGQILAGQHQMNAADTQQRELATKAQSDLENTLTQAQAAASGSPPINGRAAVPGNMSAAAGIYMRDPRTQQLGLLLQQKEIENQQRQKTLASLLQPQPNAAAGGTSPAYGQPGFAPHPAPQASPQAQGPLAGMPKEIVELMTSGDPELVKLGTTLLEANKGIAQRPGAPVVNPWTGAVIAQPTPSVPPGMQLQVGPNGTTAAPVKGFAEAQTALNSIPNPSHGLISVKTSSGQDIQLTQPEYLDWQRSGQLPQRLGGKPSPMPNALIPQASPAATPQNVLAQRSRQMLAPPASPPGFGVVGVGQSQQDIINQARQTAGGKALDEQFAKDYATFVQGGASDSAKQLSQLKDVVQALKNPDANLTGPIVGNVPQPIKNITNPQSVAMQERVEEVVQRSLRAILGAQFTEREGERLIARAYNPRLSQSENAIRVERLFTQLNQGFQQKKAASQYFEKHGTLDGFKGKLPSIADFDPDTNSPFDPLGLRK